MPEIVRLTNPDPAMFLAEFIKRGRPAIIVGAMSWPILQLDPSVLIDDQQEVSVTEDPVGLYGPGHYQRVSLPFLEVRKRWQAPPPKKYYYMDQQPIDRIHPKLLGLIGYPEYISREQLVAINLWMGEGRLRWHLDRVDNFLAQIHGRKYVRLMPPEELPNLYVFKEQWSAIDDIDRVDFDTFPLAVNVKPPQDAILEKGEMLFIPAAWWHTTASVDSWGASVNYWYQTWHGTNKSDFERPFFSALEHLTHLLAGEVPEAERRYYCIYAAEMIRRIAVGNALPARSSGGWDNPKRIDFTPVRDRVPPAFPDL
jgi:hypothetical protein